jgi:hypothetical protein
LISEVAKLVKEHMKKTFALIALAVLTVASANLHAAIVFQTQNYSNVGTTAAPLTWNKFDLNLGTLTTITLEGAGLLSGSYSVTNDDVDPASLTANTTGRIRLTLTGTGAPALINGSLLNPISTSPASVSGTSIDPTSTKTFTLLSGSGVNESSFTSNQTANSAYYSAIGGGTFSSLLSRIMVVSATGADYSIDTALALAGGTINLTYEYTPAGPTAVPEPGTWAAAALLAGGAAFMRWRKRKVA